MNKINRRDFVQKTSALSMGALLLPNLDLFGKDEDQMKKWLNSMEDPVYGMIEGEPDLDTILGLFSRPKGVPAYDPMEIRENIDKLRTFPMVNTGHPFLDLSIKTGLAHVDATFEGDHPKYGTGVYGELEHDGFPPTIIAAVDALSSWGLNVRAKELFRYWVTNFIHIKNHADPDMEKGRIYYYGPSIVEYGKILHTATILYERAGKDNWWQDCFKQLDLLTEYVLQLHAEALKNSNGLIIGAPEADTRKDSDIYFHNNSWIVKGLNQWMKLCKMSKATPTTSLQMVQKVSDQVKVATLKAIDQSWPSNKNDWWLPVLYGSKIKPKSLTDGREASYTNYRYMIELLSSDILSDEMANRLVDARLKGGGQFCGMTRFMGSLDDWTLYDYLYGLWKLGRKKDFLISLYGHISYHQCEGHLTAYEQFNFPGYPYGSKKADYCLPSQLVAARAGRFLNKS